MKAEKSVHEYVSEYEFRGDQDYTPSEREHLLIEDALLWYLALPTPPSVEARADGVSARELREWVARKPGISYVATLRDIDEALAALESAPAEPGIPAELEDGHLTRMSDSSHYDEVCTVCGATDAIYGGTLHLPCPGTSRPSIPTEPADVDLMAKRAADAVGVTPTSDMRPFVEQAVGYALATRPDASTEIERLQLREDHLDTIIQTAHLSSVDPSGDFIALWAECADETGWLDSRKAAEARAERAETELAALKAETDARVKAAVSTQDTGMEFLRQRRGELVLERDAARDAVKDLIAAIGNRGETTSLHEWNERMKRAVVDAQAAISMNVRQKRRARAAQADLGQEGEM